MKVLHDWDALGVGGRWALARAWTLFIYALSRGFRWLNQLRYFREVTEAMNSEQLDYMETLIRLDQLSGVVSIFGIRDCIREEYGDQIDELAIRYDVDVRRHVHVGETPDPNRIRAWEPPLTQSVRSWSFDTDWVNGEDPALEPGDLPVFHVDSPSHLRHYIRYLHELVGVPGVDI